MEKIATVATTDTATAHGSEAPHTGIRSFPMIGAVEADFTPSAGSYGAMIWRVFGQTSAMNSKIAIHIAVCLTSVP